MTGYKSACAVIAALGFAAKIAPAASTVLDGTPAIFDVVELGNFNDGTTQGWTIMNIGGSVIENSEFKNDPNGNGTIGGDPQVILNLGNATLPGVPTAVTVGNLPGQFDVVQFDLRFDSVPAAAQNRANTHGDQFFLVGGPNARAEFYVNDGTGVGGPGNADTAPEFPGVGAYHTYTTTRVPGDVGWGVTYSRLRIDPIDAIESQGTFFAIDNVSIGRSNDVQPFTPFADPAPVELIKNGDFEALSNASTPTPVNGGYKIIGANGVESNGVFLPDTVVVDDWGVYFEDPNGLVPLAVVGGALEGSSYLNNRYRVADGQPSFKSAGSYVNGMIQEDILNGVTVFPESMYELTFDVDQRADTNQSESTFSVALTLGTGTDAEDVTNTVAGGSFVIDDFSTISNEFETFTFQVSGADLLAAQQNGQAVNVAVELVNDEEVVGLPNPTVVNSNAVVAQVQFDNFSFQEVYVQVEGDLNKDRLVDQNDLALAQLYLAGDGGDLAVDRQNTLITAGNTAAEVLAALNLTDFDLTGDDFFDSADIAALEALISAPGDFNGDGLVNAADYTVWRDNLNEVEDGTILNGNGNNDGVVDAADYQLWRSTFLGAGTASTGALAALAPEPTAASLAALGLCCGTWRRRRKPAPAFVD